MTMTADFDSTKVLKQLERLTERFESVADTKSPSELFYCCDEEDELPELFRMFRENQSESWTKRRWSSRTWISSIPGGFFVAGYPDGIPSSGIMEEAGEFLTRLPEAVVGDLGISPTTSSYRPNARDVHQDRWLVALFEFGWNSSKESPWHVHRFLTLPSSPIERIRYEYLFDPAVRPFLDERFADRLPPQWLQHPPKAFMAEIKEPAKTSAWLCKELARRLEEEKPPAGNSEKKPRSRKGIGGHPKPTPEELKRDYQTYVKWNEASQTGTKMDDFAEAKEMATEELKKLIDRVRKRLERGGGQ
jgi:hypothetical protein